MNTAHLLLLENMQRFKQGHEVLEGNYFQLEDVDELESIFWMHCVSGLFTSISIFVPIIIMPQMLVKEFGWS